MRSNLLLIFIFCAQVLSAQLFTEVPPSLALDPLLNGSFAFGDFDGDLDLDLLTAGKNVLGPFSAKLYANNGSGAYSEVIGTPFVGVDYSSIAIGDVDGDNDLDVVIAGINGLGTKIAKLYTNNGLGAFSQVAVTPFEGVFHGSIAFADVDEDNDLDLLITGNNGSGTKIAKLYSNDGTGIFSEVAGTPFEGLDDGSIAFGDIDGDNDQDVLLTGSNISETRISKLYTNNGTGGFTEYTGLPFDGVYFSSIAFADVDSDNDLDVLITGRNNSNNRIAKLFANDGLGGFSEVTGTPFDGVYISSVAFEDIDADNDQDVLILGSNNAGGRVKTLYVNDGLGNFTEMTGTPFVRVYGNENSIAFGDVDGDNDQDILLMGNVNMFYSIAKLYLNDGLGVFYEVQGRAPFEGVLDGSSTIGDMDGDNDQDVLIVGANVYNEYVANLYANNGAGVFTKVADTPFEGVISGSVSAADIDGDSDQDVLITGLDNFNAGTRIAKLYTNDGTGVFSEVTETPFAAVYLSAAAFGDFDGDNDQDVIIAGHNITLGKTAKLYVNDGTGNFSEVTGTPFAGASACSITVGDVDGDGDLDVLIMGLTGFFSSTATTKLYINDGVGHFSMAPSTPFLGLYEGSAAFGDIDGDQDLDLLICGGDSQDERQVRLYANNGAGGFSEVFGIPFLPLVNSSIAFGDVDLDDDLDLLYSGWSGPATSYFVFTNLYLNDGLGNFIEMTDVPFENISDGVVSLKDIDGDSDLDALVIGGNAYGNFAKLYINNTIISSTQETIKRDHFEFVVYPNPVVSNQLNINYAPISKGVITLEIYDLSGHLLKLQREQVGIGTQTPSIDVTSLKKGAYIIQIDDGIRKGAQLFFVQ